MSPQPSQSNVDVNSWIPVHTTIKCEKCSTEFVAERARTRSQLRFFFFNELKSPWQAIDDLAEVRCPHCQTKFHVPSIRFLGLITSGQLKALMRGAFFAWAVIVAVFIIHLVWGSK